MKSTILKIKTAVLLTTLMLITGSMNAAQQIDHADSAAIIQNSLKCDLEYATKIRHMLMTIDDAIYNFLDFKHNKHNHVWHVAQFNHFLKEMHCLIKQGKPGSKAVKTLQEMYNKLKEMPALITNAGNLTMLGIKLKPIFDTLKTALPEISLTIESRLQKTYGYVDGVSATIYLAHIRSRLEI